MDKERLKVEQDILERKMPENSYRFMDLDTTKPYLVLAAKTNRGNVYTLRIELDEFPNNVPELYVKSKIILKSGQSIPENDEFWNTLYHKDGMIGIRHYGQNSWTPMVSLYNVYLRGKMWLENYDNYMYNNSFVYA
jgi:hypothetical protein